MAKCRATCIGDDRTRSKVATRLGSQAAIGRADTWHTFATVTTFADGHGFVDVKQNDKLIHTHRWGPEDAPELVTV